MVVCEYEVPKSAARPEALTPLARASSTNCLFQVSKPPAPLPHCAALAAPAMQTPASIVSARTVASLLIPEVPPPQPALWPADASLRENPAAETPPEPMVTRVRYPRRSPWHG